MYTTIKISNDQKRAIMLRSHHQRNTKRSKPLQQNKRSQSVYGSKSYNDALQRAFNKAKEQIYFNPDMTNFITLTYAENMQDLGRVLHDVKMLVKRTNRRNRSPVGNGRVEGLKYIFVLEYQKRGAIHVHMIANSAFLLQVNKNGYKELAHWPHGYSSVLQINDFDKNFRPNLYLFKYMKKAQRIGKSFIHTSKNLTNYQETTNDQKLNLHHWRTITQELTETTIETTTFTFYKNYLQIDDTIMPLTI